MKIIIVGLGKVGYAIAQQMVGEEHDLILVDESAAVIEHADATLDAMCVEGNGACASVLLRAGVRDADLVIAATADDEVNLVCSLMAKKLGAKHTVARVNVGVRRQADHAALSFKTQLVAALDKPQLSRTLNVRAHG